MRFVRLLLCALAVALSASSLWAQEKRKLTIVCSTTQVADFTRQVVGDRCVVKSILAPGQDPHLYQVTAADSQVIATADLCFENGWHLEGKDWMRTLAQDAGKPIVSCVTGIEPYELKQKEIAIHDPHAWFTPKNAGVYIRNILHAVCEKDPAGKEEYEARAALYMEQLRSLNQWIVRQCNAIPANRRVLVTSHDAFNYFCREYGFKPTSPAGWSTGQEIGGGVTPARKRETVESIRALGVKAIFVETSVNEALTQEIAREAGVKVGGKLYSDSMGVVGSAGENYLGMMRENVITIVHALK